MFTTQGFSNLLNLARIAFQKKRKKSQYILYPIVLIPEKVLAPHSGTLVWKISWMEEPGGLQSTGSLRVGDD